jgi:Nuclease-related domain
MASDPNEQWAAQTLPTAESVRTRFARFLGLHADERASNRGANGERIIGWWLGRLPDGWFAFHEVPVGQRGANIDHLVIGPSGVFTINTKNLAGEIVVGSKTLTHNGHRTDFMSKASEEARRAAKLLSTAIRRPVEVRGLLAILADEWTIVERPADVFVGGPRGVKHWMLGQPSILRSSDVIVLAAAASKPETWALRLVPGPCPCGGQMVPRTRRSDGQAFLGCSRYPTCRRSRSIGP